MILPHEKQARRIYVTLEQERTRLDKDKVTLEALLEQPMPRRQRACLINNDDTAGLEEAELGHTDDASGLQEACDKNGNVTELEAVVNNDEKTVGAEEVLDDRHDTTELEAALDYRLEYMERFLSGNTHLLHELKEVLVGASDFDTTTPPAQVSIGTTRRGQ